MRLESRLTESYAISTCPAICTCSASNGVSSHDNVINDAAPGSSIAKSQVSCQLPVLLDDSSPCAVRSPTFSSKRAGQWTSMLAMGFEKPRIISECFKSFGNRWDWHPRMRPRNLTTETNRSCGPNSKEGMGEADMDASARLIPISKSFCSYKGQSVSITVISDLYKYLRNLQ